MREAITRRRTLKHSLVMLSVSIAPLLLVFVSFRIRPLLHFAAVVLLILMVAIGVSLVPYSTISPGTWVIAAARSIG